MVGPGRLGAAIAAEIGAAHSVSIVDNIDAVAGWTGNGSAPAVVIAADGPDRRRRPAQALPSTVSWTPVRVELGTVVIGPTVTPGVAGCADCAEVRRVRVRPDVALHDEARQRFPDRYHAPDPALTSFGVTVAARLTSAEVTGSALRLRRGTVRLRLNTMTVAARAEARPRALPGPRPVRRHG